MFESRSLGANAQGHPMHSAATKQAITSAVVFLCLCSAALGKDKGDDDDSADAKSTTPNIYLDLRTIYTTLPAGTLSIGLGSVPPLLATLPSLSSLPTSGSRSIAVDMPLTIDLNDRVSVYGGVSGTSSQIGEMPWSSFDISSWNVGFQADVYQQNGGKIPTVTVQTTLTRSIPDAPLATTSLNAIVEADYALNADETRGLLAGIQYTGVAVDSPLAHVNPNVVGYLGAYYQWDNNWKLTGRFGVQSFGGAQLLNLTPFQAFTEPIIRLDIDRMDENDNRLFGVSAQIAWTPKAAYQLTIRTPLYAVRH